MFFTLDFLHHYHHQRDQNDNKHVKRVEGDDDSNSNEGYANAIYSSSPPVFGMESQMDLYRLVIPRLTPVWDTTLEDEVYESQFNELNNVNQALRELHELQSNINLKTLEMGRELEHSEQLITSTDMETRGVSRNIE